MSRLFEALQRSEVERTGTEFVNPIESVADLLKIPEPEVQIAHDRGVEESFTSARVVHPAPTGDSRLVCLTDQGGLGAETFRVLGLKLRHMREKRSLKRIVVTSTIPEEGKSVVAANLALNQARSKILKAVLVDGDLRRPTQAVRLGFGCTLPGLSECLRGEVRLTDVVYRLDGSGLWFLPSGTTPENPIELMQSGGLAAILDKLGEFFDWVIIDSPPILPMADTPLWMKLADGVLLVAREGVSEKKMLKRAVGTIDPTSLIGVVVNGYSGNSGQKYYYSRYSPAVATPDSSV